MQRKFQCTVWTPPRSLAPNYWSSYTNTIHKCVTVRQHTRSQTFTTTFGASLSMFKLYRLLNYWLEKNLIVTWSEVLSHSLPVGPRTPWSRDTNSKLHTPRCEREANNSKAKFGEHDSTSECWRLMPERVGRLRTQTDGLANWRNLKTYLDAQNNQFVTYPVRQVPENGSCSPL